jgi:hypothetical protein
MSWGCVLYNEDEGLSRFQRSALSVKKDLQEEKK